MEVALAIRARVPDIEEAHAEIDAYADAVGVDPTALGTRAEKLIDVAAEREIDQRLLLHAATVSIDESDAPLLPPEEEVGPALED